MVSHISGWYIFTFFFFHGINALFNNFGQVILEAKGLNLEEIGIATSIGAFFAMILPPVTSKLLDYFKKISLQMWLVIYHVIAMGLCSAIFGIDSSASWIITFVFAVRYSMFFVTRPMFNTLGINYQKSGINVNYGIARGMGALGYAAFGYIGSLIAEWHSPLTVLLFNSLMLLFTAFLIWMCPEVSDSKGEAVADNSEHSYWNLLVQSRYTLLFFCICVIYQIVISMGDTYILEAYKRAGGSVVEMGIGFSIMAISEVPTMFFLKQIMKKIKTEYLFMVVFVSLFVKFIIILLFNNVAMVWLAHATHALSTGIMGVCVVLYAEELAFSGETMKMQTLFSGIGITLGIVIGNYFGGFMLMHGGVIGWLVSIIGISVLGLVVSVLLISSAKKEKSMCKAGRSILT